MPIKYLTSCAGLDYTRSNKKKRFSNLADLKVFCARHIGNIVVLCECLKKHVRDLQRCLINFWGQKGITVKNTLVFQGKLFKPDSFLKYFDFKLIYSDLNNFNKNKYVRLKYTSIVTKVQTMFSGYLDRSFYVLIQNYGIKNLRNKLKAQLSKKNSCLNVDQMICYLNAIILNSFKQYNISFTTVRQFFSLNNLLHKLFYKYLLRKYSSLPKIYSYIKTHFKNQGRFKAKNKCLFRVTGTNFSNSVNLYNTQNISDKKQF